MFSSNEIISSTQIKKLLIFDMISISIILLPGTAAAGAGRDGLTAIVLGSLAALGYSLFFLYASSKVNGEYMEFSTKTTGKLITFIFGAFYIIKILFSCWFTLMLFAKVITDTLLPDTNAKIIIFTLILVSVYAAARGIEVRARITEILFYIVIIPLILLFIFGFKRIELTNLFPLFTEGSSEILSTSYSVLLTYSAVEILMFAAPALTKQETKSKRYKSVIQAIFITAAINLILFILVLGLLGPVGAGHQFKSSIMIMQLIQIPGGIVQRLDAVMLTIWMLSIFTILSAYFYYLSKITNSLIRLKSQNYHLIFFGVLLLLLNFIQIPIESLFYYYEKYMAYIGLPGSICIPLIIIIVSKIKSRKGEAYEKKVDK